MSVIERKVVQSADGTAIYAEATGDKGKPVAVFIHGFAMTSSAFDGIFEDKAWTSWGHLIRYDVRGNGRSGKPTADAAWASGRLAEDFDAVMAAFGVSDARPFVVGWSLGGTYITDILASHPPSYLSGIVYAAALPYMGPTLSLVAAPAVLSLLPALTQTSDVDLYQAASREFVGLCYAAFDLAAACASATDSDADHRTALGILGAALLQPRAVTVQLLSRTQDPGPLLAAGRAGALPLLVLNGTEDKVIQRQAVVDAVDGWDARQLRVVDLEGAEHFLWLGTGKEAFGKTVRGWVGDVLAAAQRMYP
ncbi:Hydrolase-4 domain-containing protein [Mycena indigotica]|uniref:Hydrolase-4 domain-containing protein n=1 Tax=Mycena indigotica TaxID=2126181 RepID=A0A8H6VWF7_9AGAR|nr:Hydrolase-4 domain-containing protein [Mycena indigotica]KAF7290724.1 Hydrolase-4 domain-containing protein [Mycena indigotica]